MTSRAWGAATLLALVLLAACSSGDEGNEPAAASSGTPSSASAQDPGGPSTSPSTGVGAATGRQVETEVMRYRLPDARFTLGRGGRSAHHWDAAGRATDIDAGDLGDGYADLDELAAGGLEVALEQNAGMERGPDRTVDGVECYYLAGEDPGGYYVELGALVDGQGVEISFSFPERTARADAWVESVIASIEWK